MFETHAFYIDEPEIQSDVSNIRHNYQYIKIYLFKTVLLNLRLHSHYMLYIEYVNCVTVLPYHNKKGHILHMYASVCVCVQERDRVQVRFVYTTGALCK